MHSNRIGKIKIVYREIERAQRFSLAKWFTLSRQADCAKFRVNQSHVKPDDFVYPLKYKPHAVRSRCALDIRRGSLTFCAISDRTRGLSVTRDSAETAVSLVSFRLSLLGIAGKFLQRRIVSTVCGSAVRK